MAANGQTDGQRVSPEAVLNFTYTADDPWTVVRVSGALEVATVGELRAALAPPALPAGRTCVALDLSAVSFCDSSGIGALVGVHKRLKARGGQLILLAVPANLTRRLEITGVDRFIPVRHSIGDV